MTHVLPEAFAAFVGIDWAEATHAVCLQAAGAAKREGLTLEHPPEAIEAWGTTLRTRCNGPPSALCLALTTGPLVSAWRTDDFLVLLPINPLTVARYRDAFTPSRATDDPTDAARQLALLLTPRDTLQPLQPPSPTMRAREQRVAHRRRRVDDTVRSTNRLPSPLKNYVPQVLQGFRDKATRSFCDFLRRWPPLTAVQLARRSPLDTCCHDHPGRSADGIAQRLHAIKTAPP
jgi:Transposase